MNGHLTGSGSSFCPHAGLCMAAFSMSVVVPPLYSTELCCIGPSTFASNSQEVFCEQSGDTFNR